MSSGSSSTVSVNSLVFAGGDPWTEDVDAEETDVVSQLDQYPPPESSAANVKHSNGTRVSIYVQVFEEMLSTALQCEPHLFNEEEIISFSAFANLSYNARLLIVRLLLRKPASWHRLDSLRYQEEMGGIGAIIAAIDEICKSNDDSLDVKQDMKEEREVVDLTLEEEFDRPRKEACPIMDVHASIGSVTPGVSTALDATPGSKSVILAENDDGMSLEALLGCLKKEELKSIAKELQLKSNQKVGTQYTPTLLVAALLPRFKKRAYPSYEFSRSKDIWKTREALLEYEEVLILEGQIDTILGGQVPPDNQGRSGLLAPVNREKNGKKRAHSVLEEDAEMEVKPESSRLRGARLAKEIFDSIYPRWLALKDANTEERRNYGLDRFESGHVLTRIVCKGSYALGVLGHYQQELEVLGALLQQNRWCRGRRGRWHERRALILATHLPKSQENVQRALLAVIDALEDPDTHLIYRPKLQRRLARLEKLLKLSPEDRHTSEGRLTTAKEVVFHAVREQRNGKTIWVGRSGEDYITVEALALQRYEGQGYKGKCIGGDALSMICRVLCEDYTARMSGGPDLFLWNTEKRCCKFVEVKGPGDTLQENQKIWIDVLVRAPVPVEICYVIEQGNEMVKDVKRRRKTRAKTKGSINNSPGSQDEYIPVALHEKTDHLPNFTFTSSIQPTRPCTVEQADFKPTTLRLRDTPPQQSSPWKGKHSSLVNPPEEVLTPPKKRPKICDD
ncbi:hypothetical protein ID866_3605 [Astraeus odoratus]|nr:hypothetical protein ID866_3605 [Astraeus odoratus]